MYNTTNDIYSIFCYFVNVKRFSETFRHKHLNIEIYKSLNRTNIDTVKSYIPID